MTKMMTGFDNADGWKRRDFVKSVALLASAAATASGAPQVQAQNLISFRIGPALWLADAQFQPLLEFFDAQPGVVDELTFFTSATHPPLPLDVMEQRAARLSQILPKVRQHGMRAGINVLSTMGHHEENLRNSLQAPWQRVRDPQGRECRGTFCAAHPELIGYARKLYAMMAQANPDFIWVDDDVRLQGHGQAAFTCFCDLCVEQFSRDVKREFSRESLVAAFSSGSLEERLKLRRQWLERNRQVLDNLLRNIEEAAHAVKPGLPLGFMTGDRFYEGYDFKRWAKTLSGPGKAPVRWRPGGGFYSDEMPSGMVSKAHDIGRQVAAVPVEVVTIQSEVESFPYQRLRKSEQTTVSEAAAYMAAGTTGSAFNVLTMQSDPLDEYAPLFRKIGGCRDFYAALRSSLGRSQALGIWPAWNHDLFSVVNADGAWPAGGGMPLNEPYVLGEAGIPLCYDSRGATATALSGAAVLAFGQEALRRMFSGSVLMDVAAWQALKRLGLERWSGISAVEPVDHDATEFLTKHALNGRFAGWARDCRQSFWHERAWNLTPAGAATEILARMVDYGGAGLGPCMTACTNELGGRVVVMGYFPWSQIHSLAKISQLKAVCEWLSHGSLPAVVESFSKVVLWCRQGEAGRQSLVLLNASLDPAKDVVVRWRTKATTCRLHAMNGAPRTFAVGESGRVHLPDLAPWNAYLLEA